jgi:hypothetical protein
MLSNDYYCQTLLPTPSIDWESVWAGKYPPAFPKWKEYSTTEKIWSDDVYSTLQQIGLTVRQIRVFKWGRNRFYPWHIDGSDGKVSHWAINWVVNGTGQIQWNENLTMIPDQFNVTGGFKAGTDRDPYTCQTNNSGNACLVKIDVPHRVITLGDKEPRESISIFFNKSAFITFDEAKELLASVNLIGP